jgi:hypothetical protein
VVPVEADNLTSDGFRNLVLDRKVPFYDPCHARTDERTVAFLLTPTSTRHRASILGLLLPKRAIALRYDNLDGLRGVRYSVHLRKIPTNPRNGIRYALGLMCYIHANLTKKETTKLISSLTAILLPRKEIVTRQDDPTLSVLLDQAFRDLGEALQESLPPILTTLSRKDVVHRKRNGIIEKVIVAGCTATRPAA